MRDDGELVAPKMMETLDELITTKRAEFYRQGRPLGERIPAEAPDRLADCIGIYREMTHEYDSNL